MLSGRVKDSSAEWTRLLRAFKGNSKVKLKVMKKDFCQNVYFKAFLFVFLFLNRVEAKNSPFRSDKH